MGVRSWVRKVCRGDKHGKRLGSAVNLKKVFSAQVFARLPCDHKLSVELGSNSEFIESWGRPFLQPAYTSLTNTRHTFQKIFSFPIIFVSIQLFKHTLQYVYLFENHYDSLLENDQDGKKYGSWWFWGQQKIHQHLSTTLLRKNIQEVSQNTVGKKWDKVDSQGYVTRYTIL